MSCHSRPPGERQDHERCDAETGGCTPGAGAQRAGAGPQRVRQGHRPRRGGRSSCAPRLTGRRQISVVSVGSSTDWSRGPWRRYPGVRMRRGAGACHGQPGRRLRVDLSVGSVCDRPGENRTGQRYLPLSQRAPRCSLIPVHPPAASHRCCPKRLLHNVVRLHWGPPRNGEFAIDTGYCWWYTLYRS